MKIIATIAQTLFPEVDSLSHRYRSLGGTNKLVNGMIEYEFSSQGESGLFTQGYYMMCVSNGLQVDRAIMFTEQPMAILDEFVPEEFPDSDRMTWREYLFAFWITDTGTVLMQAAHYAMDEGLDDETRKIWHDHFGGLLTKGEGMALIPTETI